MSGVLEVRPVRVYESFMCSQLLLAMNANGTVPDNVICSLQDDEEDTDCKVSLRMKEEPFIKTQYEFLKSASTYIVETGNWFSWSDYSSYPN